MSLFGDEHASANANDVLTVPTRRKTLKAVEESMFVPLFSHEVLFDVQRSGELVTWKAMPTMKRRKQSFHHQGIREEDFLLRLLHLLHRPGRSRELT